MESHKQVFCKPVEFTLVKPLLDTICEPPTNGCILVNETSFLKMMFHGYDKEFLTMLRPYYHLSKLHYLDRKFTYKSFVTILRQVCKACNKNVSTSVKHFHSKQLIEMTILL